MPTRRKPRVPDAGGNRRAGSRRTRAWPISSSRAIQFYSTNPAVQLDLGGYAKGYALDVAAAILQAHGVKNALVNIGGNVIALGTHGDRPWRVGIQHPRKPGTLATLDLHDGEAIGTSGDYQRYFELDGKRYCHLIDPRTGHPAHGMQSVTVLIPRANMRARARMRSRSRCSSMA